MSGGASLGEKHTRHEIFPSRRCAGGNTYRATTTAIMLAEAETLSWDLAESSAALEADGAGDDVLRASVDYALFRLGEIKAGLDLLRAEFARRERGVA